MNIFFCPKCYNYLVANNKLHPDVKVDTIVFRCKVPIFSIDPIGIPIVYVWDCDKQEYKIMTQLEYENYKNGL